MAEVFNPRAFNAGLIKPINRDRWIPTGKPQCDKVALMTSPALPEKGGTSMLRQKKTFRIGR
jgi:hypothetical protein